MNAQQAQTRRALLAEMRAMATPGFSLGAKRSGVESWLDDKEGLVFLPLGEDAGILLTVVKLDGSVNVRVKRCVGVIPPTTNWVLLGPGVDRLAGTDVFGAVKAWRDGQQATQPV